MHAKTIRSLMMFSRKCSTPLLAGCLAWMLTAAALGQSYEYDKAGRLIRAAYPEGGGIAYAYDETDNMIAVMPIDPPAAPMGVEVTRLSSTSARISWQTDPAANGYVIERRAVDSAAWEEVASVSAGTNVFIDPGLEAGVDYIYRISATNDDGRSAPSPEATFSGPPSPSISENGVINGASFETGRPIAPGSMISVFGENLGIRNTEGGVETITESATTVPLSTTLGDYSLRFGEVEAPLFFVGGQAVGAVSEETVQQALFAGQINAQVPWEVELGQSDVTVVHRPSGGEEQESDPVSVMVAAVSPALFTFDFGPGRAAALNVRVGEGSDVIDGSFAHAEGAVPGAPSQPAKLGGVVTLFANGLGPTEPDGLTGDNSLDELRPVKIAVRVTVGGAEARVLFAGLTPQFVGLYQINIIVPQAVVPGEAVPVIIEQGGATSRSDVTIAVRP